MCPVIWVYQRGAGIAFIVATLFYIPDSQDPGYMNQQGWLPPCWPIGLRGRMEYKVLVGNWMCAFSPSSGQIKLSGGYSFLCGSTI